MALLAIPADEPQSKFLGNSAATIMEGEDRLRLLDRPEDGDYIITMPNTYARGILFGKMVLELGDHSTVDNHQTGYSADVDFRTKVSYRWPFTELTGLRDGSREATTRSTARSRDRRAPSATSADTGARTSTTRTRQRARGRRFSTPRLQTAWPSRSCR